MKIPFPIASMLHSSSAIVFGHEVYSKECPWFIKKTFYLFRAIKDGWYWILYRLHPKHQYHLVRTGLKPGYYDEDTLILHACMAMLCRYIDWHGGEKELSAYSGELRDPSNDPSAPKELKEQQADSQDEALAIYRWWKHEKPADELREHELVMEIYGGGINSHKDKSPEEIDGLKKKRDELWALHEKIRNDEQTMLHRLIDIRQSLWT